MKSLRNNDKAVVIGVLMAVAVSISGCASRKAISPKAQPKPAPGLDQSFISENRRALEPFSHVVFCKKYSGECAGANGPDTVELTPSKEAELVSVNRTVNSQIAPRNDTRGDDVWTLSPRSGDCEDYAVTKRHVLIQRGWPSSALRLAIGYTRQGEGHLVLAVRTSNGDVILDNTTNSIRNWQEAGLNWQEIQSAENPRVWYKI
jgi:predicted transglutaminase-like cysteine proteinase